MKVVFSLLFITLYLWILQVQASSKSEFDSAESKISHKILKHTNAGLRTHIITPNDYKGSDTEQVFITNCQTNYTGVAIRASDNASIHHVYINGVITKARPDTPAPYGGSPYTVLVGGRGYGDNSVRGKINNIYANNLIGDGKSLILVESPIADCQFINGIYTGNAPAAIIYSLDKNLTTNITEVNLIKVPVSPEINSEKK